MENKFYVQPFGGSQHDPEQKITFLTPVPRIVTKAEAVNLVANVVLLLSPQERNQIGKLVAGEAKEPASTEFPKMLYDHTRNREVTAHNAEEEKAAKANGASEEPLAKYDHGALQKAEEESTSVKEADPIAKA